jgi:hypothetical protein
VKNVATGQVQQTPADAQGRYSIVELPIGSYEAQASAPGFQTLVHTGITLTVGAQSVVDFSLTVGQTQQAVTVESQVSQVDTLSSSVASYVEQTQINNLPLNGRNFTDLVSLAPGVSSGLRSEMAGGIFCMALNPTLAFPVRDQRAKRIFWTTRIFRVSGHTGPGRA